MTSPTVSPTPAPSTSRPGTTEIWTPLPLREISAHVFHEARGTASVSAAARAQPGGEPQRSTDCTCGHIRERHVEGRGTKTNPSGRCTLEECKCRKYVRTDAKREKRQYASRQYILALEGAKANPTQDQWESLLEHYGLAWDLVDDGEQIMLVLVNRETGTPARLSPVLNPSE